MNTTTGEPGTEFGTYPGTESCCTAVEPSLCEQSAEQNKSTAALIGEKADHAVEAVGVGLEAVGRNIREHVPDVAVIGPAGHAVGDKLEAGGHYLEDHGLSGIAKDVTEIIRRNPIPLLLCGLGLGFLMARMTRR
jgi:hypothetical protein